MKKRTLFLHIGLPKCASSSLQIFFAMNAEKLKIAGINYPEVFSLNQCRKQKYGQGNAYSIVYWLFDADQRKKTRCSYPFVTLENILDSVVKDQNILLSTEWFTVLRKHALEHILEVAKCRNLEVEAFYFYRDIMEWNISELKQALRMGKLKRTADYRPSNPFAPVTLFESVFGVERVHGMFLSREINAYTEALNCIGANGLSVDYPNEVANKSFCDLTLLLQMKASAAGSPLSQKTLEGFDSFALRAGLGNTNISLLSIEPEQNLTEVQHIAELNLVNSLTCELAFNQSSIQKLKKYNEERKEKLSWGEVEKIAEIFRRYFSSIEHPAEIEKNMINIVNKLLIEV